MVETQTRTASRRLSDQTATGRIYRMSETAPVRSVVPRVHLTVHTESDRTTRRSGALRRRRLVLRGEAYAIASIVLCFCVVCALGIAYLAVFASVAAEGRAVHVLQSQVLAAQAQHETLVDERTRLSSTARIGQLAVHEGMVANAPSEYITLGSTASGPSPSTQVAFAP